MLATSVAPKTLIIPDITDHVWSLEELVALI
jgi:hypothetical protein